MKKIFLLLLASATFAACNETTENVEENSADVTNIQEESAPMAMAEKDPTCGMERDASWTEYTVNGTDTTWFCSETCKEVYDAGHNDAE